MSLDSISDLALDSESDSDSGGAKLGDSPRSKPIYTSLEEQSQATAHWLTTLPPVALPTYVLSTDTILEKPREELGNISVQNVYSAAAATIPHDQEVNGGVGVRLEPRRVISIAISGASSSGKTTLALLLAQIFELALEEVKEIRVWQKASDETDIEVLNFNETPRYHQLMKEFQEQRSGKVLVVHEDDFALPKSLYLPIATFRPTQADASFVARSQGQGYWNRGAFFKTAQSSSTEKDADSPGSASARMLTGGSDSIQTLHVDTWESIDIPSLVDALRHIRETGTDERYMAKIAALPYHEPAQIQGDTFLPAYMTMPIMDEIVCKVIGFLLAYTELETVLPIFNIVEGSLLFPKPPPRTRFQLNTNPRDELLTCYDIKVFLPTSKCDARLRRFSRSTYLDPPLGGRKPGQMWKCEGYFEDVAWVGYETECGWLFEDGLKGAEMDTKAKAKRSQAAADWDITLRENVDADVHETLVWAAHVILDKMGKLFIEDEIARREFAPERDALL